MTSSDSWVSFPDFSVNGGVGGGCTFSLMWESFSCIFLDLSGAGWGERGGYSIALQESFGITSVINCGSYFLSVDM